MSKLSLKSFDMFGKNYQPYFNRERNFRSSTGAIISITSIFFIMFAGYHLSETLFDRNNPFVLTKIIPTSPRVNLTFNFVVAFLIEDQYGNRKEDANDYFDLNAYFITLDNFDDSSKETAVPLSRINNTMDRWPKDNELMFMTNDLSQSIAFEDNVLVGGYFDNSYTSWISFKLSTCSNVTSNKICKSPDQILNYSKNLQLSLYYEHYVINPNNYSIPFQTFISSEYFIIDPQIFKQHSFFFQEVTVSTDRGWVESSIYNETKQRFEKNIINFRNRDEDEIILLDIRFFTSENSSIITYRTYTKVQDILAQLVTIFNIIFAFFQTLTHSFYMKKMEEIIMKTIFDIYSNDMEIKSDLELNQKDKNKFNEYSSFRLEFLDENFNDVLDGNENDNKKDDNEGSKNILISNHNRNDDLFNNNHNENKEIINAISNIKNDISANSDNSHALEVRNLNDADMNKNNLFEVKNHNVNDNNNDFGNIRLKNSPYERKYTVLGDKNLNDIDINFSLEKSSNNVLDQKSQIEGIKSSSKVIKANDKKLVKLIKKENHIVDKNVVFNIYLNQFMRETFCGCLIRNKLLKKNLSIYYSLIDYVKEFTDVLKLVEVQNEIEKLKYFLFNEPELAIFNCIENPQNPSIKGKLRNVSKLFQFSRKSSQQKSFTLNLNNNERLIKLLH